MNKEYYFQGWYFKCSTQDETIAVIVGSAKEKMEEAFIQVILSKEKKSYYIPYKLKDFNHEEEPFKIQVGDNIFTKEYMYLNIINSSISLTGCICFDRFTTLPQHFLWKGLMGPFGYLPFMECYHDVLSMRHNIWGSLLVNNRVINFEGGKGYIEKDFGNSFPKSYVWMQCNHFREPSLSVMLAVADIPFVGLNFIGFLCVISIKNEVRIFTTYTGAKLEMIETEKEYVSVQIRQGKELIKLTTYHQRGNMLKAPNKGAMKCTVYEELVGQMRLQMYYKDQLKVDMKGTQVAFERVGEVEDMNHKIGVKVHMNK